MNAIEELLKALAASSRVAPGYQLDVNVSYVGDEQVYEEWAPLDPAYVVSTGLVDPGFGSGPVSFDAIRRIEVLRIPRHAEKTSEAGKSHYREVFNSFEKDARLIDGAIAEQSGVIWRSNK